MLIIFSIGVKDNDISYSIFVHVRYSETLSQISIMKDISDLKQLRSGVTGRLQGAEMILDCNRRLKDQESMLKSIGTIRAYQNILADIQAMIDIRQ